MQEEKEEKEEWEPIRSSHPDLPMEYWAEGGDIFWESEWIPSEDAPFFLDSASEFDNEEMPDNYERLLKAFSASLSIDDSHYYCRMKFFYFGDSGRLHVLCKDEDEEDFEIHRAFWEKMRRGESGIGMQIEEEPKIGFWGRIWSHRPYAMEVVSAIILAGLCASFVLVVLALSGVWR